MRPCKIKYIPIGVEEEKNGEVGVYITFTFTYPLTAGLVGAPQMISQPVPKYCIQYKQVA